MIRLIDNNKAVEISIREWDEENSQYGARPVGRLLRDRRAGDRQ